MDIVVLLKGTGLDQLRGRLPQLTAELQQAAQAAAAGKFQEEIKVELAEGSVEDAPVNTKVSLIAASPALAHNAGRFLVGLRQNALQVFARSGLQLEPSEVHVRAQSDEMPPQVPASAQTGSEEQTGEFDYEAKARQYVPSEPHFTFEQVILAEPVEDRILDALAALQYEKKVFDEWGLREIQPNPSSALSFFGPSGTGKTMAAEAVASKLGKTILKVSYADVESKYHGEGPKMVKAIFLAAERDDAVLFFDEADSLLSKRLTDVTQGSEQAINSMRSQLLICLEDFHGIVIFATNLVTNYDSAFLTRLISINFSTPDQAARQRIWEVHLRPAADGREHRLNIPLAADVNTVELAQQYDFVGRDIRNAVIAACVSTARAGSSQVDQVALRRACDRIVEEKKSLEQAEPDEGAEPPEILKDAIEEKLRRRREDAKPSEAEADTLHACAS